MREIRIKRHIKYTGLLLPVFLIAACGCFGITNKKNTRNGNELKVENGSIACVVDENSGKLTRLYSSEIEEKTEWLSAPWDISFTNAQSKEKIVLKRQSGSGSADTI